MNNMVQWFGLDQLESFFKRLPQDAADRAAPIVAKHAKAAEIRIHDAYPVRTGRLRDGLHLELVAAGPFGAAIRLINRAPHANIFENGTQARHTTLGAFRGAMPPGHVFHPIADEENRAMVAELIEMLRDMGFEVTGAA